MRIPVVLLPLALSAALVQAQDPGALATQQAAQIANQQTMIANQQATQQANEAAMRASPQAAQSTQTLMYLHPVAARPKFSVKPGAYPSALQVKIRDASRGGGDLLHDGWMDADGRVDALYGSDYD